MKIQAGRNQALSLSVRSIFLYLDTELPRPALSRGLLGKASYLTELGAGFWGFLIYWVGLEWFTGTYSRLLQLGYSSSVVVPRARELGWSGG